MLLYAVIERADLLLILQVYDARSPSSRLWDAVIDRPEKVTL